MSGFGNILSIPLYYWAVTLWRCLCWAHWFLARLRPHLRGCAVNGPRRFSLQKTLEKVYRLYDDPLDRLKEALHPLRKKYHRDFHALQKVSFSVKRGETLGILGKNGSREVNIAQDVDRVC